jgi:antitoxin VapB
VIEGSIAKCRFRLTVQEADRIRQLGRDAGAALDRLPAGIAPGETESGIAEKLRAELAAGGMTSVVTLVAADERIGLFRHPVPTGRRWEKVLLLVTCAKRGGLIVSLSRMICSGPVPGPLQRKTEACAFVNASLLKATLPGTTGAELYQAAADAYRTAGCGAEIDLHHQGGAGGYKTREWVAHPQSREVVHADQPFAWNPSITGTKVEETVLTRDDSIQVLTASTLFPSIATEIGNRTFLSPGILSL